MNIYVANVPYTVRDQDLRELFEPFGEVTSAKIIMDRATNRSRGFGFVEMADDNAGLSAIEPSHGTQFHGRSAFRFSSIVMPPMEGSDLSRMVKLRLTPLELLSKKAVSPDTV